MTSRAVRIAAAPSAAFLLAACGGGSDALDHDTAAEHAMNAVVTEVQDPGSTVYHHRIRLVSATPYGKRGWFVRIANRTTGGTICVVDLARATSLGTSENIHVVPCPAARPSAPAPAP